MPHFVTAPSAEVLEAVKGHYHLKLSASRIVPDPLKAKTETKGIWNGDTCDKDRLLFVGRFTRPPEGR